MKKLILLFSGLAIAGALHAGELEDAKSLFEQKKYPEAFKLYTKLANAGNVEAQQNLGQMYWYGEAGQVDEAKAEQWFRKAAAKGNAVAVASLELMKQRVARACARPSGAGAGKPGRGSQGRRQAGAGRHRRLAQCHRGVYCRAQCDCQQGAKG